MRLIRVAADRYRGCVRSMGKDTLHGSSGDKRDVGDVRKEIISPLLKTPPVESWETPQKTNMVEINNGHV